MRVDQIVCLGDVATLDRSLQGDRDPARMRLRLHHGNHDEFLVDPALPVPQRARPVVDAVVVSQRLGRARFPARLRRARHILDEGRRFSCFTGRRGPTWSTFCDDGRRSIDGYRPHDRDGVRPYAPDALRQHRGTLLVNPGSVGLPFQEYVAGRALTGSHAEYATIETDGRVSVSHRVPLDARALHDAVQASDVTRPSDAAILLIRSVDIEELPTMVRTLVDASQLMRGAERGFRFITLAARSTTSYEALQRGLPARREVAALGLRA
jgi:predicted phosphodiesterase